MTMKSSAKEMVKNYEYDEKVRISYNSHWKQHAIILSLVAVGYIIFYTVLHELCRPMAFSGWLFGMIFINIIAVFVMLSYAFMGARYRLSNGKNYNTLKGILLKVLCFLDSMVPMMFAMLYFYYDVSTDSITAPVWKIVVYSPLVFGAILLLGAFWSMPAPYSSGNDKMSKADFHIMRQEQELAGLDPDKMPFMLSPDQIKGMSKADWYELGMELEFAGYDVFKR